VKIFKKVFLITSIIVFVLILFFLLKYSNSDKIVAFLQAKNINPYLIVLLIATLPIIELRGAIPIGVLVLKLNFGMVLLFSIIGNILPIFFVLYLFKYVEILLRKVEIFSKLLDKIFARTMAKSEKIEKYEELGLSIFVGIPLPVTGAWTGALIAYLLNFSYKKSLFFISLGLLLATTIVSILTLLAKYSIHLF